MRRHQLIHTAAIARLLGVDPVIPMRLVKAGKLRRHPSSHSKKVLVPIEDVELYVGHPITDDQIDAALFPKT